MLSVIAATTVVASTATVAVEASSQKQAEAAVEYRESLFHLLKSNMGPLGAMAKGRLAYDAQVMKTNGMRIEQLADMMSDYLSIDTRKFDVHTEAKDSIWEDFSRFESKIGELKKAASALQVAASSGDESLYRGAISNVGAACKGCHDDYKED
nr:cytochrome c [Alteromonas aestuariivivens]